MVLFKGTKRCMENVYPPRSLHRSPYTGDKKRWKQEQGCSTVQSNANRSLITHHVLRALGPFFRFVINIRDAPIQYRYRILEPIPKEYTVEKQLSQTSLKLSTHCTTFRPDSVLIVSRSESC